MVSLMMTTSGAGNVSAVAIDGTFDDCQAIVKGMFGHNGFREQARLSGVNSINWARIVAQVVYYFTAAVALGAPARKFAFAVPTGNFGDVYAGYVAARMGLPIDRLIVATNVNDILARTLATGTYEPRAVVPTTGRLLFALVAPQTDCEVLEIGGSRGYSTIWFAAGVRYLGGRVLSIERDPAKCEAWRRNIADAGLEDWADLIEGEALEEVPKIPDVFDVVFIDAEKEDYEELFALARPLLEVGGLVVADNVLSHADPLARYSRARHDDASLSSVTLPLDRGLELTTILVESAPV